MMAFGDSRGIALPTAMIALVLLTTLLMAFAVVSRSEPAIAANHARTAQARLLAEAGVERALWALNRPALSSGIPDPMAGGVANAPYDGRTFIPVAGAGGFFVTVARGGHPNERSIESVGWSPTAPPDPHAAQRRIRVVLGRIKLPDPPAALSARGQLDIRGSVLIDSRVDSSCGAKAGTFTTGDTSSVGPAAVYGHGNDLANETIGGPSDIMTNQPPSVFDDHVFDDADLDLLRSLAKCCGTYFGPSSGNTWSSNPSVRFDTSNRLPTNGLIFIDTRTGVNPTPSTPDADLADVRVTGNAAPTGDVEFRGWLVVNGRVVWQGHTRARGLVYVQDDLSWSGTEPLHGALMSRNVRGVASTNISDHMGGNSSIIYDCMATRPPASLPHGWFLKAGSYREVSN